MASTSSHRSPGEPASRSSPRDIALLALLALAALVGGCLGGSSSSQTPGSAIENRSVAEEVATGWDPEAELVSIAGGEGELERLVHSASLRWLPQFVDGVEGPIGDGRSPIWAYEYQAGEDGFGVLVAADGTVVDSREIDTSPQPALARGLVDSTEAVQAAADEHPARAERETAPLAAAYALYHDETHGGPVWALGLLVEDTRQVVLVDALSGETIGAFEDGRDPITPRGRSIGPQTPPRAADTFEGNLGALQGRQSWAIALPSEDHPALALRLEVHEPVTGTVNATLTFEGRRLVQLEAGVTEPNATASWPLPEAGDHELVLELEDGVDQGYTVHWCAPGTDDGADPTPACEVWASRQRRG